MAAAKPKKTDAPDTAVANLPMGEIATVFNDPFQNHWGGIIRPRDETLATRGGSRGIWIYEDLKRDARVQYGIRKLTVSLLSRRVKVDPASDAPLDVAAADWWRENLTRLRINKLYGDLIDAQLKGYAVVEAVYYVHDAHYLARFKARDQRRFVFDETGNLRLLTREQMLEGVPLPDRQFIVLTMGASDENPYGIGTGSQLFWLVLFKRQGITFWLTFIDKLGVPTTIGKYPNGANSADQQKLRQAIASIRSSTGITIPEGMLIEFLEARASGNVTTQEQLVRYMDEQIDAVLGLESAGKQGGGALAAAAIDRREIRLDALKALDEQISEAINGSVVRWLTEVNFPGAQPPIIYRDCDEVEDVNTVATRDKALFDMGFRRTLDSVTATYGEGYEDIRQAQLEQERAAREAQAAIGKASAGGKALAPGATQKDASGNPNNVEFAADDGETFPDQQAVDVAIDAVESGNLQALALPMVKPLIDWIGKQGDGNEALKGLVEAYPDMDVAVFERLISRALFVSMVWGRVSAQQEIDAAKASDAAANNGNG